MPPENINTNVNIDKVFSQLYGSIDKIALDFLSFRDNVAENLGKTAKELTGRDLKKFIREEPLTNLLQEYNQQLARLKSMRGSGKFDVGEFNKTEQDTIDIRENIIDRTKDLIDIRYIEIEQLDERIKQMKEYQSSLEAVGTTDGFIVRERQEANKMLENLEAKRSLKAIQYEEQRLSQQSGLFALFNEQVSKLSNNFLGLIEKGFGPQMAAKMAKPLFASMRYAAPIGIITNFIVKAIMGSLAKQAKFMQTMQPIGGFAGRTTAATGMRNLMLMESVGTFLSAEKAQSLYTEALRNHLYTLSDVSETEDYRGQMQRISIARQREMVEQTARTTFAIQALGRTIGLDEAQAIQVGAELFNRFNIEIEETGESMNIVAALARQMHVNFTEVFEPLSNIAEELRYMNIGFNDVIGNSLVLMESMNDLRTSGDEFWESLNVDEQINIFDTALTRLKEISDEQTLAFMGGLKPGQTFGGGLVEVMGMGPIQRGLLMARRMQELGLNQLGRNLTERAAVLTKTMPGLEGPAGLRVAEVLLQASGKISEADILTMAQPQLQAELEKLVHMTAEQRAAFGDTMKAVSKEPLEIITEFLEKIYDILSGMATAPIFKYAGGSASESILSGYKNSQKGLTGINVKSFIK